MLAENPSAMSAGETEVSLKEFVNRVVAEHETRNLERIRALERQVADLERLLDAKLRAIDMATTPCEEIGTRRLPSCEVGRSPCIPSMMGWLGP